VETQECTNLIAKSTHLKRSSILEQPIACKKIKTMNTLGGDLLDSSTPVLDATKDSLEELMTK